MEKHFVETYFRKGGKVEAVYLGLREKTEDCSVQIVSYKISDTIAVPSWFDNENEALAYCERVRQKGRKKHWLVQEFRYSDDRLDRAKIVVHTVDDFYPYSFDFDGQTINDKNDGKVSITHVRSLWFCDRNVAARYVAAFNQNIHQLVPVRIAS